MSRWLLRAFFLLVILLPGLAFLLGVRPALTPWLVHRLDPQPPAAVQIRWLGTSTLLITDGSTHLLTDGYFSRVPLTALLLPLAPDEARIRDGLARAGIAQLDAVFVLHSHFDHGLDAPRVAALTGADLVGSASTANLGRGDHLPEQQIRIARDGARFEYGALTVTFVEADHVPQPGVVNAFTGIDRTIDRPVRPPAPAWEWKEGGSWALLVEHPQATVLIAGSAGFRADMLAGKRADVALLSTAGLGRQGEGYAADYLRHTVGATGASLVVPIHWDDFFRPLAGADTPPLPRVLEDMDASFELLRAGAERHGARFALLLPDDVLQLPLPAQ